MNPLTIALIGSAVGAAAGGAGGIMANSKRAKPQTLGKYSGYTPPHVSSDYFRPVESMISETLMRRSQGQDVGFDPVRRTELQKMYDIDFNRAAKDQDADLMNRLSGSGQSRNLAAQQALLGRAKEYRDDTRSKYMMGLDVEDLTRRADDTRFYTSALQDQNKFNFGQENKAADFDLAKYSAENNSRLANYEMDTQYADQYQNPWGTAVAGAAQGMSLANNFNAPKVSTTPQANGGGFVGNKLRDYASNPQTLKKLGYSQYTF